MGGTACLHICLGHFREHACIGCDRTWSVLQATECEGRAEQRLHELIATSRGLGEALYGMRLVTQRCPLPRVAMRDTQAQHRFGERLDQRFQGFAGGQARGSPATAAFRNPATASGPSTSATASITCTARSKSDDGWDVELSQPATTGINGSISGISEESRSNVSRSSRRQARS